jgi:6-phosphogluconolactonase (cycloisomerase 2 family)
LVPESSERFAAPAGSGPRHCTFGRGVLYAATELSDEVLVYSWPEMDLRQRIVVNPERPGGGGHLVLSPDGRFLYVSSRLKGDGIAVLSVGKDGLLSPASYVPTGAHPRHFCLSPDGALAAVACRDDDRIQLFHRSADDGSLTPEGQEIAVTRPVFVEII